jgi:phosphohistidine phosphatase
MLSSDARRTRETATLLLGQWEDGVGIDYCASLYLASAEELKSELLRVSDEVETLLVLGHNPGWEGVVYRLTGESITMKTATAALLQAECETWGDAFRSEWILEGVVNPRDLE